MWLTKAWADMPHMRTQGNKTQSWQSAFCPTENNLVKFILTYIICLLYVPSLWALCVIVRSFPLSQWGFTKPTCICALLPSTPAVGSDKSSSYLAGKTKKDETMKCLYVGFTVVFTLSWSAFCFSLFFLFVRHSLFLDDTHFINHACQRLSLNPLF